ncbi:peptidase A22B, signal peptide peptidase, partial [Coemansia spiralis]
MALGPIYLGSFYTLDRVKSSERKKKKRPEFPEYSDSEDSDAEENETVTTEDAYMFPVYGSVALFSMYLVFKYLNKDWVNTLLSAYFALMGVVVMTQVSVRVAKVVTHIKLPLFHVNVVHRSKSVFNLKFTYLNIVMLLLSCVFTLAYVWSKNWVLSNVFGLALSVSAINLIRLDSFKSGMIMLMGLFVYDIFWVFGTEVMVSVARNFDAPIKVVAPKSFTPQEGKLQFTMLGLGDIIIPGVFVALCLRFDRQRYLDALGYSKDKPLPSVLRGRHHGFAFPKPYFASSLAAYVLGLVTTIGVMHAFGTAQPALLYLSPACILSVLITAGARREIGAVFGYAENKDDKKE